MSYLYPSPPPPVLSVPSCHHPSATDPVVYQQPHPQPQLWLTLSDTQAIAQAVNIYKLHKEFKNMQTDIGESQRIIQLAHYLGHQVMHIPVFAPTQQYYSNLCSTLPADFVAYLNGLCIG